MLRQGVWLERKYLLDYTIDPHVGLDNVRRWIYRGIHRYTWDTWEMGVHE